MTETEDAQEQSQLKDNPTGKPKVQPTGNPGVANGNTRIQDMGSSQTGGVTGESQTGGRTQQSGSAKSMKNSG